jgi:hypothetical protein
MIDITTLIGKIVKKIEVNKPEGEWNGEEDSLIFKISDNEIYRMYHEQDCCESVYIDDICGNMDDLLDTPILVAEERTNEKENDYQHETWTFYELATIKGSVTIKWYGSSNGYYSERVNFERICNE